MKKEKLSTKIERLFILLTLIVCSTFASASGERWNAELSDQKKSFIKNMSQFDFWNPDQDSKILYAVDWGKTKILFTEDGVIYRFDSLARNKKPEITSADASMAIGPKYNLHTEWVQMRWQGSNKNARISGEDLKAEYFNYSISATRQINNIPGYSRLIYYNIYDKIDVVYEFHPDNGIKYSLVLHPGADPSLIQMIYSGTGTIKMNKKGGLIIPTDFGNIIDHAPLSFYMDNPDEQIRSSFLLKDSLVSFSLAKFDATRKAIIDPWTQTPNFSNTNWNSIWECERDGSGNVYVIGGTSPVQLLKYDPTGNLLWTYNSPYDTTEWLGTFATDLNGNSYLAQGSPARIHKINTAGAVVWNNPNPGGIFTLTEFWNISFNCDQTKLIIGGTGGTFIPPRPYIYDVDMNTGNITQSVQVAGSGALLNDQEVRSITACNNGRYYFLTHDSIGYIHQSLSTCVPGGGFPFRTSSGADLSYKCENWRYNNSGIMALSYYNGFVFMHRGDRVEKRSFQNANIVNTAAIPGGSFISGFGGNQVGCSGIDIDSCGNVYVGSTNAVHKFDQNLNLLSSYATTYNVYDVEVNSGGEVIACGSTGNSGSANRTGTIQSFNTTACKPQAQTCCDATICQAGPFCDTDPPINLTSSTAGGTWSGTGITNPSTGTFDPSVSGTGTFVITYSLACGSETMTVIVTTCSAITVCQETNGDLTVSGGTGPVYSWQVAGTTQDCSQCLFPALCQPAAANCPLILTTWNTYSTGATATPPGTWPIRVQDGTGGTLVINSMAGIPPCSSSVNINVAYNNILCNGVCTGTASATPSGGTAPYTFSWSSGQSTSTVTGLCAGNYSVNVSDASSASATSTFTISQPTAISATNTVSPTTCGGNTGSATITAAGGAGGYSYSWNTAPSQTGATATGLMSGGYTCTITDANGCTATTGVIITTTPGVSVTATSGNILCNGDSTGSASVTASGGVAPYTYSWSNGLTTSAVSGLPAGTYTAIVTDNTGCIGVQTIIIAQPAAMTPSISVTNSACNQSIGSVTITTTGGASPYSYNWNNGQSSSVITGLSSGTYSCVITDSNGCTLTTTTNVSNTNAPQAQVAAQINVPCNGGSTGAVGVIASGGSAPYTYQWSNGSSAQNISGLGAGTYTLTLSDSFTCTSTLTVSITEPPVLNATVASTATSCGENNGSSSITSSGGTSPYSYNWSNGSSTSLLSGLTAGSYSCTVTDANGCTSVVTTSVAPSSGPTASAGVSTSLTIGGSATLAASGGGNYTWSPATGLSCTTCQNPVASPSTTIQYCVVVSDTAGCADSACIYIYILPDSIICGEFYIPNAFSPNGDNENDVFHVYIGDDRCITEFTLYVFSRWGELVFESHDPLLGWDGQYDGKMSNTAVYTYYCTTTLVDGTILERKGNVSLVR